MRIQIFPHIILLATLALISTQGISRAASPDPRATVRVGITDGDIKGADNVALQAAIDHMATLGGGVVRILPGKYLMRNALTLRDNVDVIGTPGESILVACDGVQSPLAADGDCYERQITLADPTGFHVGDGVTIQDDKTASDFSVTTATLTSQVDANTFRISSPLYLDYMVKRHASARLRFPVVGGWNVKNARVEGLTIEGNRAHSQFLDGCRVGGIYLFQCQSITLSHCTIREYNGDAISFQVCDDMTVEDCLAEKNSGSGLHPGSGSHHPIFLRNRCIGNDADGVFVCWRVKDGLFDGNEFRNNKRDGISIGHKDTDNLFRNNIASGNGSAGVLFRNEDEPMGAHRNVFENNHILDNGSAAIPASANSAEIVILGHHHGLIFRNNEIGNTSAAGPLATGIIAGKDAVGLKSEENRFVNLKVDVNQK